jgi:signal transduction histidine kinase
MRLGLSGKLVLLTIGFVMLAEVLIFVPSVANFRNRWLQDRIAAAQTAALVIEAAPADAIADSMVQRLLDTVGAHQIALKIGGVRRLIAAGATAPDIDTEIDLRTSSWVDDIIESFGTLVAGNNRVLRVVAPAPQGAEFIELVMNETPLRAAMLRFSRNIFLLSLFISGITGSLLYASLDRLIMRPVRRLSQRFSAFSSNTTQVFAPSQRQDELGDAERELSAMQTALAQQIKQQQHLASLGLAVAKINHDLRNLLSSAQLMSDRIASAPDPTVQRLAPKLVSALDRAVAFCQGTLAFGKAEERPPSPRKFDLARLTGDLRDLLGLGDADDVDFKVAISEPFIVNADPDHLLRVLMNLSRNSLEALRSNGGTDRHQPPSTIAPRATLEIVASRTTTGIEILVRDNGPGVPPELRARLFKPFTSTRRIGATGLGLAIADELMRAQGGSITLLDSDKGACFRLTLPS